MPSNYMLIRLQEQAEAKENLKESPPDLRLSSSNHKQKKGGLFEGLIVTSHKRSGGSSRWKHSSSLPSPIMEKAPSLEKPPDESRQFWLFPFQVYERQRRAGGGIASDREAEGCCQKGAPSSRPSSCAREAARAGEQRWAP